MKNCKSPTREQRKLIVKIALNGADWFVFKDTPSMMKLVSRSDDMVVKIIAK